MTTSEPPTSTPASPDDVIESLRARFFKGFPSTFAIATAIVALFFRGDSGDFDGRTVKPQLG